MSLVKLMYAKNWILSSQNLKTNLLRHVTCFNTFSSHCLYYMLLETILRFFKRLQKNWQWLFVNVLFADSLRFVLKKSEAKSIRTACKIFFTLSLHRLLTFHFNFVRNLLGLRIVFGDMSLVN